MKILILNAILYTPNDGVIPKVESIKDCMIYNLSLAFKSLGHEVTLIASEEYKPIVNETYEIDIVFLKSRFKKIFSPSIFPFPRGLYSYLKKNKDQFDIIISSETFAIFSLCSVLAAKKKTIIWHELNVHNKKFCKIPSYTWYNIVTPLCFRNVLTVARSEPAQKFISRYTNNVSPVIIDHGVNLHKFYVAEDKKKQFIVVAQLIARKNIASIISTFSKFVSQEKYGDYKLLIAGKGELEEDLKNQCDELGIENSVDFLGFLGHDELSNHVSESLALLIDTMQDNNMVSISESIVSGTPILTNKVPTSASFIQENKLGIAKTDWTEKDMNEIVENNSTYTKNCLSFQEYLSNEGSAKLFIELHESRNK